MHNMAVSIFAREFSLDGLRQDTKSVTDNMELLLHRLSSPCGIIWLAVSEFGICWTGFEAKHARDKTTGICTTNLQKIKKKWPKSVVSLANEEKRDKPSTDIESFLLELPEDKANLVLYGTHFQKKVWRDLMTIPTGEVRSYKEMTDRIGNRTAVRAVGTAVGQNPLSLLVPCHRVIHSDGRLGNFAWGACLKKQLLDWEGAKIKSYASNQ